MSKLFLVPKVDTPNNDLRRELDRTRNLDTRLEALAAKFAKPRPQRVNRRHLHVVETINFFGDFTPEDAA